MAEIIQTRRKDHVFYIADESKGGQVVTAFNRWVASEIVPGSIDLQMIVGQLLGEIGAGLRRVEHDDDIGLLA